MRNLADYHCSKCKSEFYGDLPAGQGLYTPILLDKKTCTVTGDSNAVWFSGWLADSYAQRTKEPLGFETRKFSQLKDKVVLLNCLDTLYGHSLLKLLNAQHYIDHRPDVSLIVILPRFLEWMLPDGVAEAWIIDLPLKRGTEWNDWLANEISQRLESVLEIYLSIAFSHPHSEDFDIERFTRTAPFPLEDLGKHEKRPVITFIWREDRLWEDTNSSAHAGYTKHFTSTLKLSDGQTLKVVRLAESLRSEFTLLDFAVAGLGEASGMPDWISDLRLTKLDDDAERRWCERYAKSHIVVGVHGSNMLLPSAHAGSVIEIIGGERWGNYLQDILFRTSDPREMLFRYRFVPHSSAPEDLAGMASTILRFDDFRRLMSSEFCQHREKYDLERWLSRGKVQR
ncbi:MAG: hypothetical protein WKF92_08165 [Pyrinomonadaceae bacterium]